MTSRPDPTWVYHITRIEHIASMIEHGVLSDRLATERGASSISIAHSHLEERRARRTVPVHPYGTLADYTPFYFAPRSAMLFAIRKGKVHGHGRTAIRSCTWRRQCNICGAADFRYSEPTGTPSSPTPSPLPMTRS